MIRAAINGTEHQRRSLQSMRAREKDVARRLELEISKLAWFVQGAERSLMIVQLIRGELQHLNEQRGATVPTPTSETYGTFTGEEDTLAADLTSMFGKKDEGFLSSPLVSPPQSMFTSVLDPGPSTYQGVVVEPPIGSIPPPHPIHEESCHEAKEELFYELVDSNFDLNGVAVKTSKEEELKDELELVLNNKYKSQSMIRRVEFSGKTKIRIRFNSGAARKVIDDNVQFNTMRFSEWRRCDEHTVPIPKSVVLHDIDSHLNRQTIVEELKRNKRFQKFPKHELDSQVLDVQPVITVCHLTEETKSTDDIRVFVSDHLFKVLLKEDTIKLKGQMVKVDKYLPSQRFCDHCDEYMFHDTQTCCSISPRSWMEHCRRVGIVDETLEQEEQKQQEVARNQLQKSLSNN